MTATPSVPGTVLADLERTRVWQEDFYRDLHQHPELSHQERAHRRGWPQRLREVGLRGARRRRRHRRRRDLCATASGPDGAAARRHGRAPGPGADRPRTTPAPAAATDANGNRGPGHARLRTRRARDLPARRGRAARRAPRTWAGTLVALFQPAEELGDGARPMVEDALAELVGRVDVALAQHVLPLPGGAGRHAVGPVLSAADSLRVTVLRARRPRLDAAGLGRPGGAGRDDRRAAADRRLPRGRPRPTPAVLTVGSIQAGTKSNVIGDHAVLQLNVRTYDEQTRTAVLDAIRRIVIAECQASGSPQRPGVRALRPVPADRQRRGHDRAGFARPSTQHFGDRSGEPCRCRPPARTSATSPARSASRTPTGASAASTPDAYRRPQEAGRLARTSRSTTPPTFAPVIQPTLDTGTAALVVAALAWLAKPQSP